VQGGVCQGLEDPRHHAAAPVHMQLDYILPREAFGACKEGMRRVLTLFSTTKPPFGSLQGGHRRALGLLSTAKIPFWGDAKSIRGIMTRVSTAKKDLPEPTPKNRSLRTRDMANTLARAHPRITRHGPLNPKTIASSRCSPVVGCRKVRLAAYRVCGRAASPIRLPSVCIGLAV
jgi:hypothetical protein